MTVKLTNQHQLKPSPSTIYDLSMPAFVHRGWRENKSASEMLKLFETATPLSNIALLTVNGSSSRKLLPFCYILNALKLLSYRGKDFIEFRESEDLKRVYMNFRTGPFRATTMITLPPSTILYDDQSRDGYAMRWLDCSSYSPKPTKVIHTRQSWTTDMCLLGRKDEVGTKLHHGFGVLISSAQALSPNHFGPCTTD